MQDYEVLFVLFVPHSLVLVQPNISFFAAFRANSLLSPGVRTIVIDTQQFILYRSTESRVYRPGPSKATKEGFHHFSAYFGDGPQKKTSEMHLVR